MSRTLLLAGLLFFAAVSYAADVSLEGRAYSMEATASIQPDIIQHVYEGLKTSGLLPSGYPQYAKTETEGAYAGPYTIKAFPVTDVGQADAILTGPALFLTFQLWVMNTRAVHYTDFIYLLKEDDDFAIHAGRKGAARHKYIELSYRQLVLPPGSDRTQAGKIVGAVRQSLLDMSAQEIPRP